MRSINRQVAIIEPKEPYKKWINSLPNMNEPCDIDGLRKDCTAILLPHYNTDEESLKYVQSIFRNIFEIELDSWSTDKKTWPKKRNFKLFCEWFRVTFHSECFDFGKGPIEIEAY
jgi:hypothetical protein